MTHLLGSRPVCARRGRPARVLGPDRRRRRPVARCHSHLPERDRRPYGHDMVTTKGWYPDPWQEHDRRWWDGANWTGWVIDAPVETTPPPAPAGSAAPPASAEIDPHQEIAAFLEREAANGAITAAVHRRLLADLAGGDATSRPAAVGGAPAPTPAARPGTGPLAPCPPPDPPRPRPAPPRPRRGRRHPRRHRSHPRCPLRPPSPAPHRHSGRARRVGPPGRPEPRSSPTDLAIHGLAYAGVALVLTGVLGFVVFAFGDVGEAWRPLAEIATAAVLLGTGSFLRRRGAPFVGDVLLLLGGMVVPILLVAAFVDGAPVPPDLTGGALALVLTPLMLAVAGLFALAARRRPDSPVRFLVAPMLWWSAAAAGLAFADAGVAGRDVTHPIPWQWALVAVAVTATLVAARLRPDATFERADPPGRLGRGATRRDRGAGRGHRGRRRGLARPRRRSRHGGRGVAAPARSARPRRQPRGRPRGAHRVRLRTRVRHRMVRGRLERRPRRPGRGHRPPQGRHRHRRRLAGRGRMRGVPLPRRARGRPRRGAARHRLGARPPAPARTGPRPRPVAGRHRGLRVPAPRRGRGLQDLVPRCRARRSGRRDRRRLGHPAGP